MELLLQELLGLHGPLDVALDGAYFGIYQVFGFLLGLLLLLLLRQGLPLLSLDLDIEFHRTVSFLLGFTFFLIVGSFLEWLRFLCMRWNWLLLFDLLLLFLILLLFEFVFHNFHKLVIELIFTCGSLSLKLHDFVELVDLGLDFSLECRSQLRKLLSFLPSLCNLSGLLSFLLKRWVWGHCLVSSFFSDLLCCWWSGRLWSQKIISLLLLISGLLLFVFYSLRIG